MLSKREDASVSNNETFAFYGFELKIPQGWRVEVNPKGTRNRGDVVFHSPQRNKILVSWGLLEEARKRFKTIEEHRDSGIANVGKSRNVNSISITESKESQICGHKALVTRVSAGIGGGLLTRGQSEIRSDSVYFYCPENSRYYVVYSLMNSRDEYPDFSELFDGVAQSMVCHRLPIE